MYKQTLLENPIAIFIILLIVSVVNLFLPVHFISILLAGVTYKIFSKSLETEQYLSVGYMIIAFSVIELAQGLKLFTLTLLAFFIYLVVAPRLKNILASIKLSASVTIFIFYIGILEFFHIAGEIDFSLFAILLLNCIIDIVIILALL